jgi:hypothetical protein
MWSQTQLHPTVKALMSGSIMGSAASGSWENYHMDNEHMHIADLSLSNFIKMQNILWIFFSGWRIPDEWILDNYEFTVFCAIIKVVLYYFCLSAYIFNKCTHCSVCNNDTRSSLIKICDTRSTYSHRRKNFVSLRLQIRVVGKYMKYKSEGVNV